MTGLSHDEGVALRHLARVLATSKAENGVSTSAAFEAGSGYLDEAVDWLSQTERLLTGGLLEGVEVAEERYPVRVTDLTPAGRDVLRKLRSEDREATLVALFEATGGDTNIDKKRREIAALARIPYPDFSLAEDWLLDQGLVSGTMGGADGHVSITHSGVQAAESLLNGDGVPDDSTDDSGVTLHVLDELEEELKRLDVIPWSPAAKTWKIKTVEVLRRLELGNDLVTEVQAIDFSPYGRPAGVPFTPSGWEELFEHARAEADGILDAARHRLKLDQALPRRNPTDDVGETEGLVFIGHGRSPSWRELKDFLQERLGLRCDEFNRVTPAGVPTQERLREMLDDAIMAFLVMTAEDETSDGEVFPRLNVVHEAGLFQGRLGFRRAIVLLEEGCDEFSNIHGLGQIRFPRGRIAATFEEVRQVLEREKIIPAK